MSPMTELEKVPIKNILAELERRGEKVSPLLPNANWIQLKGRFTPFELRSIADHVEEHYGGKK